MDMKKGVNIDFKQIQEKIKAFFNNAIEFLKNLPETVRNAPQDEQIAYGAIGGGILFFLIGLIWVIVV